MTKAARVALEPHATSQTGQALPVGSSLLLYKHLLHQVPLGLEASRAPDESAAFRGSTLHTHRDSVGWQLSLHLCAQSASSYVDSEGPPP